MPTSGECIAAFNLKPFNERAERLDSGNLKGCACEVFALTAAGGDGLTDETVLARVLTDPKGIDKATGELVADRLLGIHQSGFSVIRTGASDAEIIETVRILVDQTAEPQTLVGAATVTAGEIRQFDQNSRWFGVYATDVANNLHHADILGTMPDGESKSKRKEAKKVRQRALNRLLKSNVIKSDNEMDLIIKLRALGI